MAIPQSFRNVQDAQLHAAQCRVGKSRCQKEYLRPVIQHIDYDVHLPPPEISRNLVLSSRANFPKRSVAESNARSAVVGPSLTRDLLTAGLWHPARCEHRSAGAGRRRV